MKAFLMKRGGGGTTLTESTKSDTLRIDQASSASITRTFTFDDLTKVYGIKRVSISQQTTATAVVKISSARVEGKTVTVVLYVKPPATTRTENASLTVIVNGAS